MSSSLTSLIAPNWTQESRPHLRASKSFKNQAWLPKPSGRRPEDDFCGDNSVKLVLMGAKQVGKSALAVRYLTKRYIGEYKSDTDLFYRQRIELDGQAVELEIVDVSDAQRSSSCRLLSSDAVVTLYSITDRSSFHAAREALEDMAKIRPKLQIPVLLLANKVDLNHLRQVSISEGRELSRQFKTAFHEVSVADNPVETVNVMNSVVRQLWRKKFGHLKSNSSSRDSSPAASSTSFDRSRKISVVSRVFSNLMGRGSVPPELPSRNHSTGALERISFRKVFKKRSV